MAKLNLKREPLHGLSSRGLSDIHGATDISFAPDPDGDPGIRFITDAAIPSTLNTTIMVIPATTAGPTVILTPTLATAFTP